MAGRSILPGAAMMELAAASGASTADTLLASSDTVLGLDGAVIPAAVILTASPGTAPSLESRVDLRSGAVELASLAKGKSQGAPLLLTISLSTDWLSFSRN